MKTKRLVYWALLGAVVGLHVLAFSGAASAQDPGKFLAETKNLGKNGWDLMSTIGGVVVGGGALISLASGMYKGNWGQAAVSIVAGSAGLMGIWGMGKVLGF